MTTYCIIPRMQNVQKRQMNREKNISGFQELEGGNGEHLQVDMMALSELKWCTDLSTN